MYDNFPKITWNKIKITDISRRFIIDNLKAKYADIYYWYTIQNWISIDTLAYNIYGDSSLEWLIRLANNIDNIFDNIPGTYTEGEYLPEANQLWILKPEELEKYIKIKYPDKNIHNDTKEYSYNISSYPAYYIDKNNTKFQYFEFNPLISDDYLINLECLYYNLQDNFGYTIDNYNYLLENLHKCTIDNLLTSGYYEKDGTFISGGSFEVDNKNINPLKIENNIMKDLNLTMVTNHEHENNLNEDRRTIKIIYPELIGDIETEVKKLFNT